MYSYEEVMAFCAEEDVKFIRLAFCDPLGRQKNIAIMTGELRRAFTCGISFDASAIMGFGGVEKSDLFLFPDPSTISILPWRPSSGRVARMYCAIRYPDGRDYEYDSRRILKRAIAAAQAEGLTLNFGAEFEFYLFKQDEAGAPTKIPLDHAGYMDIAPEDRGEDVRREICLTLEDMGILPETSHHEEGPGQNEIDFRYSDALSAADNAMTFKSVVRTIAMRYGLEADFSPKPLPDCAGNGLHINLSVRSGGGLDPTAAFMAGILAHVREMSFYLNPTEDSYRRLGGMKAPRYVTWSHENRSQLIRIPAAEGEYRRVELRSPDPGANPYLAYALIIHAGLDGVRRGLKPEPPVNLNLYTADENVTKALQKLPESLDEARRLAQESAFVRDALRG